MTISDYIEVGFSQEQAELLTRGDRFVEAQLEAIAGELLAIRALLIATVNCVESPHAHTFTTRVRE